jgi:3',5'-cyclic-AMP phosphodiesterase
MSDAAWELTTVADDLAVAFRGTEVRRYEDLEPGTAYEVDGISFTTLPRPPGARLATVATVNDVHFGEEAAGIIDGSDIGPILRSEPGQPPYPEVMNRAAVVEIAAAEPDVVVAKGDLTSGGTEEEHRAFLDCYGAAFGERLRVVRGNHDVSGPHTFADDPVQEVALPGVVLAILDTSVPGRANGTLRPDQLEWLDELGARADRPVLVLGHHHVWNPDTGKRDGTYYGIEPDASEALVDVVARRPALVAYAAGHTHRNRVVHVAATGGVPYAEVAATKDFPGAWAEYRVFEGGVLQVLHRIADPAALRWTERTRGMYAGLYAEYAFGALEDRCFPIWPRT